jgi:hypothetical protein
MRLQRARHGFAVEVVDRNREVIDDAPIDGYARRPAALEKIRSAPRREKSAAAALSGSRRARNGNTVNDLRR